MSDMLIQKLRFLSEKYGFYADGGKTLVGFSGGADSMALLHGLTACLGRERIVAFHLDHMLRGADSQRDEAFCRAFCDANHIKYVSKQVNVREMSETALEETARRVRYEAFFEAAKATGCTTVSLAHHAGDNLETMLFHLCRGAGLAGLSGIPPKRPLGDILVVRPLLDCTKDEIFAYLQANSLDHVTDATNFDTEYTRNFIRHEILPKLEAVNPRALENARRSADILREGGDYLRKEAERLVAEKTALPRETLRDLPSALRHEVLSLLYQKAGGETLSAAQSDAISDVICHEKTGKRVSLTGDIVAVLDGKMLRFLSEKALKNTVFCEKIPLKQGENPVAEGIFLYLGVPLQRISPLKSDEIAFLATAKIPEKSLPTLHLRPRENGEAYRFGGMTKSLKKLLCGADLRTKKRPLLCDEDGILWHPNFPSADRAKGGEVDVVYVETKGDG